MKVIQCLHRLPNFIRHHPSARHTNNCLFALDLTSPCLLQHHGYQQLLCHIQRQRSLTLTAASERHFTDG